MWAFVCPSNVKAFILWNDVLDKQQGTQFQDVMLNKL